MHFNSMRLQQLKRYTRVSTLAIVAMSVVGVAFMYGPPRLIHAQTSTAPTPPAGCVGGHIAIPAGSDSSYLLAAVQDLMASRSQDECNQTNTYNFLSTQYTTQLAQITTLTARVATLEAKLNVNPPPPPTCAAPNTLINGVCTPPSTNPGNPKPIPSAGPVITIAPADQKLCQGSGASVVPTGTAGNTVAGPKIMLGVSCYNVSFTGAPSGWTPAAALAGQ